MIGMIQKDRSEDDLVSDLASNSPQKQISDSLFSIPGLFVGFTGKGSSECDSVRSPTSPLDSRLFSGLGSSFWSMRSEFDAHQNKKKSFCSKGVGLGIVDSLSDERRNSQGEISVEKSEKNILFGSQLKIVIPQCKGGPNQLLEITVPCITSPKSLPNYASSLQRGTRTGLLHLGCSHFAEKPNAASSENSRPDKSSFGSSESMVGDAEILSRLEHTGRFCSDSGVKMSTSDSGSRSVMAKVEGFNTGSNFSSATMLARDIELSEDYTRVITHGPNPKTKHIYGDLVLEEEEEDVFEISIDKSDETRREPSIISLPMDGFLTVCCACKKKLVEGEDIYMYRGEKAFCSSECRLQEIIIDEEMEKASMTSPVQSPSSSWVEIFRPGLAVAT